MPQLILWLVAGSAIFRLWGSGTWLPWGLGALIVLDFWVSSTMRHIHAGRHADVVPGYAGTQPAMYFWARVDMAVVFAGILLGIYGHVIA